jgi:hypothetical protein
VTAILTTITVVALEDCMIAVMKSPVSTLLKELDVIAARIERILSPATFWRDSLSSVIPYRKSPRDPATFRI